MGRVSTDLRDTQEAARHLRFEPATVGNTTITATDVQTAIEQAVNTAQNPPAPTPISVTAAAYLVGPADRLLEVNFAGNVAITLGPTSARNGLMLEIKDISGGLLAGGFTITVTPNAVDVNGIDGLPNLPITNDFADFKLRPAAAELAWRVS
jgi:hypothetical protein